MAAFCRGGSDCTNFELVKDVTSTDLHSSTKSGTYGIAETGVEKPARRRVVVE
jgi:hypothetical protein